jgi:hypothetical protein
VNVRRTRLDGAATSRRARYALLIGLCACGSPGSHPADRIATPTDSAVAVLRDYYAAIDGRDYARAYAAWGDDGPPGHPSLSTFSDGFARTDSVRLEVGTPGQVEGAAGSRYVDVPVTLYAFERGPRETRYTGSYVLRRTVVPGASEANRRWHLYRATLAARP